MTAAAARNEGRRFTLGKYEVLKHIGSGGMGAVYKAIDSDTGREVALKVLPSEYAARPEVLERFRREARHGARLRHENIAAIYEFAEAQGTYFLVMEYVDGVSLHDYLYQRKGRLEPAEAREILRQVAAALDHAHQQRIVHRDIKPANILLHKRDERLVAKVIDLGLSLYTREEEFRVTRDGTTVGTVDYLAPEQARDSRAADIRSDIYSLGCSFYQMLAGQPPFYEGTLTERLFKHMEQEPVDLRRWNPNVSDDLWDICRRMLAKKPAERFQTPAELLAVLAGVDAPRTAAVPAPPPPAIREEPARPAAPHPAKETKLNLPAVYASGECPSTFQSDDGGSVGFEQQKAAHGQFQRAAQVMADGNHEYGIQLLRVSCRLDPGNLMYRSSLREAHQRGAATRQWRLRDFLSQLLLKLRILVALQCKQPLRVLELGEEVLAHDPANVRIQLDMARAAEAAGFANLALWLLEQARHAHDDGRVNRALAVLCEKRRDYQRALSFWELVLKSAPDDAEARQRIKNLAARETISRGYYEKRTDLRELRGPV